MKKILFILFSIVLVSCNNYNYYYPNKKVPIYIDNSKIEEFNISLVYNHIDTLFENKRFLNVDILRVDTLNFKVNNDFISENNRKYPMLKSVYNSHRMESTWDYDFTSQKDNLIYIFEGNDITVNIKKDGKILESYNIDVSYGVYNHYIINPLSKSTFKVGEVQYGGFIFKEPPFSIHSSNFITLEKVDFFLTPPPDTISYTYDTFDPCMVGCKKTYVKQIK